MRTSENVGEIYAAIAAMQQDMQPIKRDKTVKTGKYEFKYAPLDSIMDMLKPLFKAHQLGLIQAVDTDTLTTRLIHVTGQWIESSTFLNKDHANMQGFGGEVTYKRRYALSSLLGIVSDEDNDAPSFRSSPTMGVIDNLTPRRQSLIRDLALIIEEKFADGNDWGAYEECVSITDVEEKTALWGLLNSKVRTAIKKMSEQERNKA
jgi:hypothetical protein